MTNTLKLKLIVAAVLSLPALAMDNVHSAKRLPGEMFSQAESRYWTRLPAESVREGSASASKVKFDSLQLEVIPKYAYMTELFHDLRDERFLEMKSKPDFKRRLSWLYPHDGCWIRAAIMKQLAYEWQQDEPYKLFIFGNLKVNTANAVGGTVSWWYHVIPVLRDEEGELWAIDPAIEASKPLPIEEWILTMVPKVEDAQFSLCSPNTYTPSSPCVAPKGDEDKNAKTQIETYLNAEWSNLVSLNRNPEEELGENPPWEDAGQP